MNAVNREWLGPLWERLASAAEEIGRIDALVVNGDSIDGPGRKDSTQHITTDINEQIDYASQALSLFRVSKKNIHIVRGTGYHTDLSMSFETAMGKAIGAPVYDELRLKIYNDRWHVRHHVGRSDIPYGQYTQAMKEGINEALQADLEDYDAADLLSRAHVHYCVSARRWNTGRNRWQEVFTNPALQLRGPRQSSYVRKLRTWMYHVGFVVIDFWKGQPWEVRPIVWPIKVYAPQMREYLCLTNEGA